MEWITNEEDDYDHNVVGPVVCVCGWELLLV